MLCLAALTAGTGLRSLWPPDEQREAAISQEMAKGGSWLIPHLADRPFVEKPPLYYWLSAVSMKVLGKVFTPTASARLVSVVSVLLLLALAWSVSCSVIGRARAFNVVLILSTMVGIFDAAYKVLIDPLLLFLTGSSILLLYAGLAKKKSALILSGYLAAGLAFLAKGFIGWALIGIPGIALVIIYYREIIRRPLLHFIGILLLLTPGLAWMMTFYLSGNPELWRQWFYENQLGRFLGQTRHLGHIKGPFYYGELIPLALLPWTPAILGWFIHRRWRNWTGDSENSKNLFIVTIVWAIGGLIFLSLAGTKRNIYLFPLLPAFAFLAADYLERPAKWVKGVLWLFAVFLLLVAFYLSFFSPADPAQKFPWSWDPNIIAIIISIVGLYVYKATRKSPLVRLAGITAAVYLVYQLSILPVIDLKKSYRPMVERLTAAIPVDEKSRVIGWEADERTLGAFSFYAGIDLIKLSDPSRLANILSGNDGDYRVIITRGKNFPPTRGDFPEYRVISRSEAEGRDYFLISGRRE